MGDTGVRRLTIKQAAERIGKRPRTVNDLIHKGYLTGFKHGSRLYTTDAACAEYLSWHPPATAAVEVALEAREQPQLARAGVLPEGSRDGQLEAEAVRLKLSELEARLAAELPPGAALVLLNQYLRKVSKIAALFAAMAAGFLWTQQVADSPEVVTRVLTALPG